MRIDKVTAWLPDWVVIPKAAQKIRSTRALKWRRRPRTARKFN